MSNPDFCSLSALKISEGIRQGDFTAVEVTSFFLRRIEELNPEINAFITINEDAIRQAHEIDRKIKDGSLSGNLAGVPVAIKDNICTRDLRTTCASRMLHDFIPPYDATVVSRLKEMGMIILGKTNMDEFGMGSTSETSFFGPVINPCNHDYVAGGSSGGSAAAVKAGMAPIALGSDTGGSIRLPSAFCGVYGIKPTYGYVSRSGLIAYCSSFDQIGVIGNYIEDIDAFLDVIKGKDIKDQTTLDLNKTNGINTSTKDVEDVRIGISTDLINQITDERIKENIEDAISSYKNEGIKFEEIKLDFWEDVLKAYYIICCAECSSNLSRYDGIRFGHRADEAELSLNELYIRNRTEGFGLEVKRRIMLGNFVLSEESFESYYLKALKVKENLEILFEEIFKKVDVVLIPVTDKCVPKLGEYMNEPLKMYLGDLFNVPTNVSGLPSVVVPYGKDSRNMPSAFQLVGNKMSEKELLKLASFFQEISEEGK